MKKYASTIVLIFMLFVGIGVMLYPTVSDMWNDKHQSKAINIYEEKVVTLNTVDKENYFAAAKEFNNLILSRAGKQYLTAEEKNKYMNTLDVSGTGIMAYIEIPKIKVSLPVYHGVSDSVLQVAVGHIEWSSLPVGGEGTHCVLSGHRGLPSADLFTNLDKITEGDLFMINVIDETLTYQVDQIRIVTPDELSELVVREGKDMCTLVTCTPYGINTHRLLVRGSRTENIEEKKNVVVPADAVITDEKIVSFVMAVPLLAVLLIGALIVPPRKRR